jgi:subtilisin family serine protease
MGNNGQEVKMFPGACDGVISVGSTDSADARSSFSNFGPWISVTAPGSKIWSTLPTTGSQMGTGYGMASGTSMATPAVAGLAGLVRSQFPGFNQAQVKAKIESSADDLGAKGFDKEFGHGRINVFKALSGSRR